MPRFSLKSDPFPAQADGEFHFSSPALVARLHELEEALGRGHVLLVDESGSGKSTLLDRHAETLDASTRSVRLEGGEQQCAKRLVHALVSGFGLPLREPVAAGLRDADALLEHLASRCQRPLIVVDDAHRMADDALDQLGYLARRWERFGIRFLLCGEPMLYGRLRHFPGPSVTLEMPRLDAGQVSDYLHMRLVRAGLVGDSPFGPAQVAAITEGARGLVGAIDPAARRLFDGLVAQSGDSGGAPKLAARRWPLGLAMLAGLGALLAIALPEGSEPATEPRADAPVEIFRSNITPAREESEGAVGPRRSASADAVAP